MILEMNDFELLYMIHQKDEVAHQLLVDKYCRVIWKIVSSCINHYHPRGVEKDDLYQEGLIALVDAMHSFREDIQAPFYSFAFICIERQVKTYIRKFNSQGVRQYYNGISLDMYVAEDENLYLHDVIPANQKGISYIRQFEDDVKDLTSQKNSLLTEFEKRVLLMKVAGYSYSEIGMEMNTSAKAIDNCIQRIKQKTKNQY